MDQTNVNPANDNQSTSNTNSSDVGEMRTITVNNVAHSATDQDLQEFFSYCGDVQYVERQRDAEKAGQAYVTFKDPQGAETAMLLTGAIIAELTVTIAIAENYQLPPNAVLLKTEDTNPASKTDIAMKKAEDVVSSMLSKGYILGKDALVKAKALDEKHHLRTNASATASKVDNKLGLKEKLSVGTAVVNEKVKEMNERYQVSERTKSALLAAEQKATVAGSAMMSNRYVSSGATWVSNAFQRVAKAAEGVTLMTKEKVEKAEEEKREDKDKVQMHLDESPIIQDQVNPSKATTDRGIPFDASPEEGVPANPSTNPSTNPIIHASVPPQGEIPVIPSKTSADPSVHDDASVEGEIPANPSKTNEHNVHVEKAEEENMEDKDKVQMHLDESPMIQDQVGPSKTTTGRSIPYDASPEGGVLANPSTNPIVHASVPPQEEITAIPSKTSADPSAHNDASLEGKIPANPSIMTEHSVHVDASPDPGGEVVAHPSNNADQSKTG